MWNQYSPTNSIPNRLWITLHNQQMALKQYRLHCFCTLKLQFITLLGYSLQKPYICQQEYFTQSYEITMLHLCTCTCGSHPPLWTSYLANSNAVCTSSMKLQATPIPQFMLYDISYNLQYQHDSCSNFWSARDTNTT